MRRTALAAILLIVIVVQLSASARPSSQVRVRMFLGPPPREYWYIYDSEPWPSHEWRGELRILVVLVEFPDVPHTVSLDEIREFLNVIADYYYKASYGKFKPVFVIHEEWIRLPNPSTYYGPGHEVFRKGKAVEYLIDCFYTASMHVDLTEYTHILFLHSGSLNDMWAFATSEPYEWPLAGGGTHSAYVCTAPSVTSGNLHPLGVVAHELGHTLGLPDLYDIRCHEGSESEDFVGPWDLMDRGGFLGLPPGSRPAYFSSWCRLKLGWISSRDVVVVRKGEAKRIRLYPLEREEGVKIVKIPLYKDHYYLVELRLREGYDSSLPEAGILVYRVDETRGSGEGIVITQDAEPATYYKDDAAFEPGKEFQDPATGVYIKVEGGGERYTIAVAYGSPPPKPLDLMAVNVTARPFRVEEGGTTTVTAFLANTGEERARRVRVELRLDAEVVGVRYVDFEPRELKKVIFRVKVPIGLHNLTLVVDPEDEWVEVDEANNYALGRVAAGYRLLLRIRGGFFIPPDVKFTARVNGVTYRFNEWGLLESYVGRGRVEVELDPEVVIAEGARAVFRRWSTGSTSNRITIDVEGDAELEAEYFIQYAVKLKAPEWAKVPESGWYPRLYLLNLTVPEEMEVGEGVKIRFKSWEGTISESSPRLLIVVTRPLDLEAVYSYMYRVTLTFTDAYGNPLPGRGFSGALSFGEGKVVLNTPITTLWMLEGSYELEANFRGVPLTVSPSMITVNSPGELEVKSNVYRIRIRVVGSIIGTPQPGVEVRVYYPDGSYALAYTNSDGIAQIDYIPTGNYTLKVGEEEYEVRVDGEEFYEVKIFSLGEALLTIAVAVLAATLIILVAKRRRRVWYGYILVLLLPSALAIPHAWLKEGTVMSYSVTIATPERRVSGYMRLIVLERTDENVIVRLESDILRFKGINVEGAEVSVRDCMTRGGWSLGLWMPVKELKPGDRVNIWGLNATVKGREEIYGTELVVVESSDGSSRWFYHPELGALIASHYAIKEGAVLTMTLEKIVERTGKGERVVVESGEAPPEPEVRRPPSGPPVLEIASVSIIGVSAALYAYSRRRPKPPPRQPWLRVCPNCGASVPLGAVYCPYCGYRLLQSPRRVRV